MTGADERRSSSRPAAPVDVVFEPESSPVLALHAMRSTILLSCVASVTRAGMYDRYRTFLDPAAARALDEAVAGTWLSVDVALAHYAACDAMGAPRSQHVQLGMDAAEISKTALVGTALRLASMAGTDTWTFLGMVGRFWPRAYQGSAVRVIRRGPKEALIDVIEHGVLLGSPYARGTFRGFCAALVAPFCEQIYVRELGVDPRTRRVSFIAQWV
jgi:hypothetical protein